MSAISVKVAALLGTSDDAVIQEATEVVTALAQRYTRGNGWTAEVPELPIEKVIVVAAARLASNTAQIDSGTGPIWERGGFIGWSLAELMVLNSYRGRSA